MAWTQPRTWVAGELVTAAIMNTHVRDQLLAIAEGTATLDHVTLDGKTTAPAVAPSGDARMYFDAGADLLKASVDGGAYRPLGGGTVWPLGGHPDFQQTSGTFDTIYGAEVLQPSYARTGTVHAMARVDGGTGQLRVYNVTDAALVGTAWDVTNTTVALVIHDPRRPQRRQPHEPERVESGEWDSADGAPGQRHGVVVDLSPREPNGGGRSTPRT